MLMEIENKIRIFLAKGDKQVRIGPDDHLFQEGFLDSMGVFELIDLIEKETGMEFDPDILLADNLSTINKIMKLVQNLK